MFYNLELLAVAIGLFFTAYQMRQTWKMNSLKIELVYKQRFDELNQDRQEFHDLHKKQTSLSSLKREDEELYNKIINWENRYFHYEFDRFIIGHKRRAVPKSLKKAWDCSLQSAMKNPIHKQAWELEIRKEYFLDKDFYNFVDTSSRKICD
ncbi:hypothetical protein [Candidatus Uabimicrobium sp. HlEnr_7]|uniref:hypothetical protein n=1 Tax=Candidatus Uabimicrobium helgolandensis TaxID=3095367 RepID=UPI0035591A0C